MVINLAADGTVDARLPFETEDFLGIAFLAERTNTVVGYLVPTAEASRAIRDSFREWLEADASHSRDNRVRTLYFDGNESRAHHGYDRKWSQYCLGEVNLDEMAPPPSGLDEVIAQAKRAIAAAARRPETAVRITIDY
jgi:hypothetical protein